MTRRFVIATILVAELLVGCGGSKKSKRLELTKQDLEIHKHVLVVPAGPPIVKLDVGTAGKLAMKGLNYIVNSDSDSEFAKSLREAGLLPRETAVNKSVATLGELGWKTSNAALTLDSPGKKFKKVKVPEGACQEAASAGADSVLVLYQRLIIDVGATDQLARSETWGHFFACPDGTLKWRGKEKKKLSLRKFVVEAAKKAIAKKEKTLADFLGSLRALTEETSHKLVNSGLKR